MEKLNKYAPYVLIICGGLIALLSFVVQKNSIKGAIGLVFMALGFFILRNNNKNRL
jgi:uncharacterized membrane protein